LLDRPLAGRAAGVAGARAGDAVGDDRGAPARRALDRQAQVRPELELGDTGCRPGARLRLARVTERDCGADLLDLVVILDRLHEPQPVADVDRLDLGSERRRQVAG